MLQQLTGHAARAVISTERRVQIWDQFYISFKETIPHYQWCTRQELVKAACSGKTGIKFTVDELTEVIRGRKHKREAGVDSKKVDGEWLYRCACVCSCGFMLGWVDDMWVRFIHCFTAAP